MADVRPIDIHMHPSTDLFMAGGGDYLKAIDEFFKVNHPVKDVDEVVEDMDSAGVALGVIFGWDAESATGLPPIPNDHIAELVAEFPDRFIGFASVDPWKGKAALAELERAIGDLGLKGLKLHPPIQDFYPNDPMVYPLYEKCIDLDIPILFHCGFTGLGMGKVGGMGIKLKYARPIYLDDVAADFPELTLIAAHNGWPWENELLAICLHKANLYIDLSGWLPKYIPKAVISHMNTLLADKMVFGSDYPYIDPKRWLKGFEELELKEGVREKVLEGNARRILRLPDRSA
ncbi:MAG: amidohydrolase [Candidatus Tectomicrobia bacterium]|uniref:Amidohydrolase n=1 Tax=Tectimicrobiota bacterium TaxID=2528274 RepID=A0A932GRU1_UNCTE|nr:amidohydrolase [Candidatus Tectomicrobia bacterium]